MKKTESATIPAPDALPVGRHASHAFRVMRVLLTPVIRALFKVRIEGRDNIPRGRAVVVAANHLGWLDAFLLTMAFPNEPRIHFLGAVRGLAARPVQWRIVRTVGGYIPVDTERHADRCLYQHVDRCLAMGGSVAVFPEGRYGIAGELQPFHKGFAHFAVKAGAPVVPVALFGTDRLWLRREVRVVISSPLDVADVEGLVAATHARIEGMLRVDRRPEPRRRLMERRLTDLL